MQYYKIVASPVGELKLVASDKGLCALWFDAGRNEDAGQAVLNESHPTLVAAERQLTEYFDGARTEFDIPLDPQGSEFQIEVWAALSTIPYGQTISYAQQARKIGGPEKARAVGQANGKNPISIIVPCHRVIGADGKLTGYGGGTAIKEFLLTLEQKHTPESKQAA